MSALECPYCGLRFSLDGVNGGVSSPHFTRVPTHDPQPVRHPEDKEFTIVSHKCPDCHRQVMWLNEIEDKPADGRDRGDRQIVATTLLYPKFAQKQLPTAVPEHIARDFQEAYAIVDVSPKASAALSRRVLQDLIRDQEGIRKRSLVEEIAELLQKNRLPRYLADELDVIREVGNFAAHPIKDTNTGEIVDVEPGEAQWTLDLTEELLRFYFEREPMSELRRKILNEKLKAAGKKPLPKT